MAIIGTGITGLPELLRRLDRVPIALAREVAEPALQAAGEIIQQAAENSAPRLSGELADDIVVETHVTGDLRDNRVSVGPGYPGPGLRIRKRGRYAGRQDSTTSPGVYGGIVERGHGMAGYGWRSRFGSASQRRRTGRQVELGSHDVPPQPWLQPAFDASSDQAVQVLVDRTREALDRIDRIT